MHPNPISPEQLAQILSEKFKFKFWSKIKIGNPDECWPWQRCLDSGGYGHVRTGNILMKAHRVAWMIHNCCVIPDGKDILHSCIGSRTCCNPSHLRPGTDLENRRDTFAQGRFVPPDVKGTKHGMHKLVDVDVLRIRELHANGKTCKEIGPMFRVTPSMISLIVRRKNWTHL